jgi:hypothetical protein
MSAVDVIFVFLYFLCGLGVGGLLGKHFGPIYGLIGFVLGFALPMILWRFIAPRLGRKRPSQKRSEDVDKRESEVEHDA